MPFFFQPGEQTGTNVDDFMSGEVGGPNHQISGGDGNDLILGDGGPVFTTAGASFDTPQTLDIDRFWDDFTNNPDVEVVSPLDRYTRIYREAPGGQADWYSVVLSAGQKITVDIDYGLHPVGVSLDTTVSIFSEDNSVNPVAFNDDASSQLGAAGSVADQDSFLTFIPSVGGLYRIKIAQFSTTEDDAIDRGATYVANITVNQHLFENSFQFGDDMLFGEAGDDVIYGRDGRDFILGGYGDDTIDGGADGDVLVGDRNGGPAPAPVPSLNFDILDLADTPATSLASLGQGRLVDSGFVRSIDVVELAGRFPLVFNQQPDNFGVRLTGEIVTQGGVHTFASTSDDGSRILIDGVVVVDNDNIQPATRAQGDVNLTAGTHTIEILYFEQRGGEALQVEVRQPGDAGFAELFASGLVQPASGAAFGDDSILGGAGDDQIGGEVGNDTIRGGDDDDAIFGGEDQDMIFGDSGSDTLSGNLGSDMLFGGDGVDTAQFDDARAAFTAAASGENLLITDTATGDIDTVAPDIEMLRFNDAETTFSALFDEVSAPSGPTQGDDVLTGDNTAEVIAALGGNDAVSGLSGDDTLRGQGGDDTLRGGADNDRLLGNGGEDVLRGQGGDDFIKGGGGADRLFGNGGEDTLNGGGGADQARGGGGGDVLDGRGGGDRLFGGGGSDTINGNGGSDTLIGNGGGDRLIGGKGGDELTGGGGSDMFVFAAGDGLDALNDFRQGQDRIEFTRGVTDFDDLTISQQGADVAIAYRGGLILVETDNANAFTAADFIFSG